jgi:urea transport system permease protein
MGVLFISVVMFFPDGFAGLYNKYAKRFKFLRKFTDADANAETHVNAVAELKGVKS